MNQNSDMPEKPDKPVRVGKLDTLADLRKELGRLYRVARQKEGRDVDAATAWKLAQVLNAIGRLLVDGELEKRIFDLEQRLQQVGDRA